MSTDPLKPAGTQAEERPVPWSRTPIRTPPSARVFSSSIRIVRFCVRSHEPGIVRLPSLQESGAPSYSTMSAGGFSSHDASASPSSGRALLSQTTTFLSRIGTPRRM